MSWRVMEMNSSLGMENLNSYLEPPGGCNSAFSQSREIMIVDVRFQVLCPLSSHVHPLTPHPNSLTNGMSLEDFFVNVYLPTLPPGTCQKILAAIVARRLGAPPA